MKSNKSVQALTFTFHYGGEIVTNENKSLLIQSQIGKMKLKLRLGDVMVLYSDPNELPALGTP